MSVSPDPPGYRLASSIVPQEVGWLWPQYLPCGSPVLLDGEPGKGKSSFVYDIAARVTTGNTMPDGSDGVPPSTVIIASAEDDPERVIVPRLIAAEADLSRVVIAPMDEVLMLDEVWLAVLEELIVKHDARFVSVDPLMAFLPDRTDSNNDASVRRVLIRVARLARRTGAVILMVRHFNKAEDMSAMNRGGGSIGIIGSARAAFIFVPDPSEPIEGRILAPVKMNLGLMPPALALRMSTAETEYGAQPTLRWCGAVDLKADDLVRTTGRPAPSREAAEAFLLAHLADGPVTTRELTRMAGEEGISKAALQRARDSLGVVSTRTGFGSNGAHACSLPHPPEVNEHGENSEVPR